MAVMNFDPANVVEEEIDFVPVPSGNYKFLIVEADIKPRQEPTKPDRLNLMLEILDGSQSGKRVRVGYNWEYDLSQFTGEEREKKIKTMNISAQKINHINTAIGRGGKRIDHTDDFLDQAPFMAMLASRENLYNGKMYTNYEISRTIACMVTSSAQQAQRGFTDPVRGDDIPF